MADKTVEVVGRTGMADKAVESVGRPMKYPYTYAAKIAQFPFKHHFQNQWVFRYYIFALIVAAPAFYKIHKLANSPGNKAKWAEMKRKQMEEHH